MAYQFSSSDTLTKLACALMTCNVEKGHLMQSPGQYGLSHSEFPAAHLSVCFIRSVLCGAVHAYLLCCSGCGRRSLKQSEAMCWRGSIIRTITRTAALTRLGKCTTNDSTNFRKQGLPSNVCVHNYV